MKRILFILAALFAVITMNAQKSTRSGDEVVAEIDWTAQSAYYDGVWYDNLAEVSVIKGDGLIINNTQTNANANYWEPQVPIIAHIPELEKDGRYLVNFNVNAPAAGEICLNLCSWDGTNANDVALINVVAGDNDLTIEFPWYPTDCTDAMLFYECGKIPGRHVIRKVQVLKVDYVRVHSLTYKVDGNIYRLFMVNEGDVITPEPEPTKEGYTFSGWSEIPETMPDHDVTVTGTFTINKYKLTYMVDGEVYKSYDVEYGAAITHEPAPTKEGYTFSGWSDIPATMPAKDVTVTGYFTKNEDVRKFESGGITYNVNDNGTTVTVTAGYSKYKGSITIPASVSHNGKSYDVTSIGYGAFSDCTELTSISLGTVMYIQSNAFEGCSGLSSITLPNSLVHIGESAFVGCSSLTNIVSEIESPFSIEGNTFDNSTFNNATLTVPAGTVDKYKATEGWKNFAYIVDETSITQDEIVYQIDDGNVTVTQSDNASGDIKIEASVVINDITYEVTVIAKGAFEGCTDITSVEIPNTIIIISEKAFAGCTGLRVIIIGNGIQEIGRKAFANLSSSNARTRGDEEGLHFYCEAEVVPATSAEAFVGTDLSKATLHVPDHMVEVYKQVAPWSGFGNIVGLSDTGIKTISIDTSDALIFDMQGNRLNYPQKGLNIIRMSDGTTKKVLVK